MPTFLLRIVGFSVPASGDPQIRGEGDDSVGVRGAETRGGNGI